MSTNNLREAANKVVVEGILVENGLMERVSAAKENYINGKIQVEIAEGETHTVTVFCKEFKKDGTENKLYKGLQTVIHEYLSVAKVGREAADRVKLDSAKLGVNDFVGGDGQLKSYPELSATRISRIRPNDSYEPKATFDVELVVQSVIEEVDRQGEETGRVKVKGYIPQFGGKIAPMEFVAEGNGAEFVRDNYESGSTVNIQGLIVNKVEITETEQEMAFGKPKKKITEKYTREYLITGGSDPYEEDNVDTYSLEAIKKALTEREVYLAGLKEKKENNTKPAKEEKKGFGGKPTDKKKAVNKDDLPF